MPVNTVRKCYHCNKVLQSEDKNQGGYIPRELLETNDGRVLLCEECYRKENLDVIPTKIELGKDIVTILNDAKKSNALIVYVVDIFSFETSFIQEVNELIKGLDIILVANKIDLLPNNSRLNEVKEYVAHRLRVEEMKALDIILTSPENGFNIEEVVKGIKANRKGKDVYIIGRIGSGKSSLLTSLLKVFSNTTNQMIVTENYKGTESRVMKLPLEDGKFIYDTPGLPNSISAVSVLEKDVVRAITPREHIKKRGFLLYPKQALVLGGLIRVDLLSKKSVNLNVFMSDKIQLKRITSWDHDKIFSRWLKNKLVKPISPAHTSLSDFDVYDIDVTEKGERDIGVDGIGWISFTADKQKFRIYVPKFVKIYTTRSKIKC